ncbi:MAG: hypothetical protein ABSF14_04240 [Terriglobia bacterium]|jgi:hypothetical protein
MPGNQRLVKERLGELRLAPGREEEILRELGEHLEDHATALETRGVAREEAVEEALNSVSDWPGLRRDIVLAETEETTMNYRTKVLWLPALCTLTLSNVLLALMQIFGPLTHFYWLNPYMGMRPFYTFLVPWLILQPVVGAVAAYWSRRAGGAVRHQLLAALAPAIALLGLFALVLPFMLGEHGGHHIRLSAYLLMTAIWALLPALPLLIGAAPFLRKPQPQS